MYGGIVSGAYPVLQVTRREGLLSFSIELPQQLLSQVEIGASVGVDGVCLTVVAIESSSLRFEVMQQTLVVTTLGMLQEGDKVNVERSLMRGAEVGGHIVSGHVDGMGEIVNIQTPPNNFVMTVRVPLPWMKYIFPKGFLAVNGCSLTVASVDRQTGDLTFYLIPETLRKTSFGLKKVEDKVNIELERNTQVLVDTVERVLGGLVEKR